MSGPEINSITVAPANRMLIFVIATFLLLVVFSGLIGNVRASAGVLSPPHSEHVVDNDQPPDGLYNLLVVNVSVNVTVSGIFYVTGELRDNGGGSLIESQFSVGGLSVGHQSVKLRFTGYLIRSSGLPGPYQVSLGLFDDAFKLLDTGVYVTKGYLPTDFQTPPAALSPPHSDYTIDSDGDTLYDYLITSANVYVNVSGTYSVEATLFDNTGIFSITSAGNQTLLSPGTSQVDVSFIGYTVRISGFDGPYMVDLRLYDGSSNLLDANKYFTNPYFSGNFEPSPAAFLDPHSDHGSDLNGNSIYEYLVVTAYVAVFVEGTYTISGTSPFGPMENQTYLGTGIQPVDLQYIGFEIENSGLSGPFSIDLELFDQFLNIIDSDSHNTAAYSSGDFEPNPPASFYPPHYDYGVDIDSDLNYDNLIVMANVTIDAPGSYEVRAELYDSMSLRMIAETANSTWLDVGQHAVIIAFDGITIHLSRSNGPYGVYLALFDGYGYQLDFDVFNTRPYAYTDFDMPPATFTPPHDDYGLDTDMPPDGLFNFLVVNASIRVKDTGWYLLFGALLDGNLEPITQAQGFSNLPAGPNWMALEFNGLNISRSGVDGPYVVVMDLYYFEGETPIRVDWDVYFTAEYNHTEFMAPSPATIWGYVYNVSDGSPVDAAQISVMNYTYGWIGHAQSNSTGYYEVEVFDGEFCVLLDGPDLQSDITLTTVTGSAEVTGYLDAPVANQMYSNLTFLDWNFVGYDATVAALADNRSIRFMIDVVVGDRNGYVDQNELDLFATFITGSEGAIPSNTSDHLRVDGIHYDLVPGTEVLAVDAIGPVVSPNPAFMYMSANFTSNATIPISTIHWLEWNVTYDSDEEASVQYAQMPTGYTLWGYDPVTNVSVSGVGMQDVVIDPLMDWNTSDDCEYAWINTTVGQGPPDSQPPQVLNATINGLTSPTYGLADIPSVLYLNATIDDASSGNVPIAGANYTIGVQNWTSSTPLDPTDEFFDSATEDVTVFILSPSTTTTYCIYGWDSLSNFDTVGSCITVTIMDDMAPQILSVQINPSTFFLSSAPPTTTLTATVDETSTGSSIVSGANYTTPLVDSWPGTPMIAVDGTYDETVEDVAANVPLPSSAGVFGYYVHAWDSNMAYNHSVASVQITIIDDLGPVITGLQLNGQTSPTIQAGNSLLVDAVVDDTGGRGDTDVEGANYTIDGDWGTSAALFSADGAYDSPTEDVIGTINTNGWSDGTHQVCVYGWDTSSNYNTTGACGSVTIYSVDDQPPNINNVLLDGTAATTVSPGAQVNLTARIHDTGSMTSNILSANFSVDSAWTGVSMSPLDGAFDSTDEYVYALVDTTGWTDATYQICVHGADEVPNYHASFDACADLTVQTPPDSQAPTIQNQTADPSSQEVGDYVRISVNVYDDHQVNLVAISVSDPGGGLIGNYTMSYDSLNGEYYYTNSYSDVGTYAYTIWASDASFNWNFVSGNFEIVEATVGPSFLEEFWWLPVILISVVLVSLLMVWRTRPPSESYDDGPASEEVPPPPPPDDDKRHVHTFESNDDIAPQSIVKCMSCGDAVLMVGDTDLLKARCDHCGSTLLEVAKGFNYLIVDEDPGVAYEGFRSILKRQVPGLCISTTFPEKLGKRYDVEGADLYWLTDTTAETKVKTLDPKRLDFEMMRAISSFLKDHPEGAVIIDGVENLIVENGFDSVFRFIKKINDLASVGGATIFVSLAPSSLGKDELATFQKEFDRVQILTSARN